MPSKHNEDLSDYVRRVMSEADISYRDVEEQAAKFGFKISNGYVSKIVSGAAQNISVDKLQALAAGLGRPEEEVFKAARGGDTADKIEDAIASAMYYKFTQLTEADKKELAALIKAVDREIDERLQKRPKK